ncbi:MAG: PAS domain-containing protein, partial [Bacteroidia bacterium]|nr:PAS domain-containing protein [Bacteroidia bacterium]
MTITIVVMAIITLSLIILSLTFYKKRQISRTEMTTLNEEKKMYEIICKESNDAMLVIDIVNGNIITANNSSADMLGYTLDELMELSVFQLYPKEYLEESSKRIAEVWENKGMVFQDLPLLTKSGDELSVESSGKVL